VDPAQGALEHRAPGLRAKLEKARVQGHREEKHRNPGEKAQGNTREVRSLTLRNRFRQLVCFALQPGSTPGGERLLRANTPARPPRDRRLETSAPRAQPSHLALHDANPLSQTPWRCHPRPLPLAAEALCDFARKPLRAPRRGGAETGNRGCSAHEHP